MDDFECCTDAVGHRGKLFELTIRVVLHFSLPIVGGVDSDVQRVVVAQTARKRCAHSYLGFGGGSYGKTVRNSNWFGELLGFGCWPSVAEGVQLVIDAEYRCRQKEELGDYHAHTSSDVVRLTDDERGEGQSSSSNEAANCCCALEDSIRFHYGLVLLMANCHQSLLCYFQTIVYCLPKC